MIILKSLCQKPPFRHPLLTPCGSSEDVVLDPCGPPQLPRTSCQRPWNKGLLVGQKRSREPKHVWTIRVRLEIAPSMRDLAIFNLAIDSSHPARFAPRPNSHAFSPLRAWLGQVAPVHAVLLLSPRWGRYAGSRSVQRLEL